MTSTVAFLNSCQATFLPSIEVYGQHEISELTNSEDKLTSLLHRFIRPDESLSQRKADVRRELKKTRQAILQVNSELDDIDDRLADLPRLEQTLERFQEAGLEDRLGDQSLLVREERVLASVPERVQVFREAFEMLRRELPVDTTFVSEEALADLPGASMLSGAGEVLEQLSRDLEEVTRLLEIALDRADRGIAEVRTRWSERKRRVGRRVRVDPSPAAEVRRGWRGVHPAASRHRELAAPLQEERFA